MANIMTNNNKSYTVTVNYNVATYKPNFTKNGKPGLFLEVTDKATAEIYRLAILGREADRVREAIANKNIRGAEWKVDGELRRASNGQMFLNTTSVRWAAESAPAPKAEAAPAPKAAVAKGTRTAKAKPVAADDDDLPW